MGVTFEMELDGVRRDHSPGWNKEIARNLWTIEDAGTFPESFDPYKDDIPPASVYYERHISKLEAFAAECRTREYEHGAEFYEKMITEIRANGEVRVWKHW
jgi:hypothetical protein